jgi:hypothetical protein
MGGISRGESCNPGAIIIMFRLAAAMALLLGLAAPAGEAQARERAQHRNDPLSVQAMRNFAICVVGRSPRGAVHLLAMESRGADYDREVLRVADGSNDCVPGGRLHFSPMLFAGGLAEALLLPRLRHEQLAPLVAYDPAQPPIVARDSTEGMALCAVRQSPAETQALLTAEPGTAAERDAAAAVAPALGVCLGQGEAMRLNRPAIRAVLALATYRLVTETARQAH